MSADVVGYSRLIVEDGARTLDALRSLRREAFEPLVAEHRGQLVKRMGGGVWLGGGRSGGKSALKSVVVPSHLERWFDLLHDVFGSHTKKTFTSPNAS